MLDATYDSPDLTTFCGLDELGLQVVGQQIRPGHAVLACRVAEPDQWCRRCGCEGVPRDSVVRPLVHEPLGWRPTTLLVTVCRYRCTGCGHVWRQDLSKAAEPRAKLTRRALRWALQAIVCQHLTVARVAEGLAVAWNTANDAVLAEGKRVLFSDPARLDGVRVLGVDEHVWRHTRNGDKYVTVIIDLTPIRDGTGPSRLLEWSRDGPSRRSRPGCPSGPRPGATPWRWWQWTGLPASRPPPAKSSRGGRSDGPVPRRAARRRRPGPVPPAGAAGPPAGTAAARATRSTPPSGPCTPAPPCSPTSRRAGSRRCSPSTSTLRSGSPGRSTRR